MCVSYTFSQLSSDNNILHLLFSSLLLRMNDDTDIFSELNENLIFKQHQKQFGSQSWSANTGDAVM